MEAKIYYNFRLFILIGSYNRIIFYDKIPFDPFVLRFSFMHFTSTTFILFFLIFFVLYWASPKRGIKNLLFLIASYLFYGWFHPWYCLVLATTTLLDFLISLGITRKVWSKKTLVFLSFIVNFGTLIFFKYNDFFLLEIQNSLIQLGIDYQLATLRIIFPLGLSFYALKKFAYILDVARQNIAIEKNVINFGLFVAFFPQITSGPIDRAQNLLPQIQGERRWNRALFENAWPLILMGFFKKLVIADSLAVVVDKIFTLQQPSILLTLIGAFGFTFQLLADFSAYTDLSRGISFLLGFHTPENFKSPYLSITPTDFWNRWHITLSEWLRDYIFFPARRVCLRIKSRASKQIALFVPPLITMLASGFWHGTGWTYIVWGFYYGLLIVLYQMVGFGGAWKPNNRFKLATARILMFGLIVFGWLIFRSPSIEWLVNIGRHSQFIQSDNEIFVAAASLSTIIGYIIPLLIKRSIDAMKISAVRNWAEPLFYAVALTVTVIYINSSTPDFIYFQF